MSCGLDIVPAEYVREVLKFGLIEVVYEWARGMPFKDICELTDIAEGTIVRTITRLDETCREVGRCSGCCCWLLLLPSPRLVPPPPPPPPSAL